MDTSRATPSGRVVDEIAWLDPWRGHPARSSRGARLPSPARGSRQQGAGAFGGGHAVVLAAATPPPPPPLLPPPPPPHPPLLAPSGGRVALAELLEQGGEGEAALSS